MPSPSTNPGSVGQAPRVMSGVENLNNTLADVRRRIYEVSSRIGDLANQFGAPHTDSAASPVAKSPESTNDWMGEIGTALSNLERITSCINNQ